MPSLCVIKEIITVRYGITVQLDFRKKYRTELRMVFSWEVRYGTVRKYGIFFRTVLFSVPITPVLVWLLFFLKIVFHSRSKRSEDFHAIWGNWYPAVTVTAEYHLR